MSASSDRPRLAWWRRIRDADPVVLAVLLGLLGALPLVLLTPPFQVPDEPAHFFRAYQVSELGLVGIVQDGNAGAVLPSSLPELVDAFLGTRVLHTLRYIMPRPLSATLRLLDKPLDPDRREFVNFTNTAPYPPFGYLPQATAIAIGRAAGAGPLALLYLGRLANAVAAVLVIAGAIRLLPFSREALLLSAMLPMELFEYGSVSQDAMVIAAAALFTAIALRCLQRGHWRGREVALAAVAGTVFCAAKIVYAPLLVIGLPAALRRGQTRHVLVVHGIIIAVALGFTAIWFNRTAALVIPQERGADIAAQMAFILADPLRFAGILMRTFAVTYKYYYLSTVGLLGWLTLPFPDFFYALPVLGLLFCLLIPGAEAAPIAPLQAAWNVFLVVASAALLMTVMSMYDDVPATPILVSIQGRYLLPLAALGTLTISGAVALPRRWRWRWARYLVPAVIMVELVATWELVALAYEVF